MAGSSNALELSLSLKPAYAPKSISNLLNDIKKINGNSEKLSVLNDYIRMHQEELARVELIFERELPQCVLLLTDAIEILKEKALKIKEGVETDPKHPLLEFLPLKRKSCEGVLDQNGTFENNPGASTSQLIGNSNKKQKQTASNATHFGNEEALFKRCRCYKCITQSSMVRPECTSMAVVGNPKALPNPLWKRNRRSWTPDLHHRFVRAVLQLGGADVATPKKIKEVMQEEGLTNDQIKSHLQKYRLHHRIPPADAEPAELPTNFQQQWPPDHAHR